LGKHIIYIDVNVIVTIINHELGRVADCIKILSLVDNPDFTICTSPITLAICFYFAEKKKGRQGAIALMKVLQAKLKIVSNTDAHIADVFQNTKINDFEDGLHYYAAIESKCKAIITYNKSDFYYSDIPVFNPKEYLKDTFC
jgi:predicted nucleic acid-binding protein